ncbi:aldehyde dehydrogenase family protein [Saccharopolyspora spinosa]|uniref:Aldehyde dehydrogenase (NAD+)/betaine-aldehyde dehydrogenase n=1 Tax=Saccharopolyspora spinosa TaxID=60894 RepID=A0A2N3Y1J4_SACSN|nr:aldehyde dehydrogenase family protein [Saccharopolyspora spinosa]PKW16775.1 aldehyde dehydrogenase (NAD+)/betaine-aldehyde dehydrogenase [Saccharopolyspora spinosa]
MTSTLSSTQRDLPHPRDIFVGGRWVTPSGSRAVPVVSPIDGSVLCHLPEVSAGDADAAVAQASAAFEAGPWPSMTPAERSVVVERFLTLLEQRLDEINLAWSQEVGIPITTAVAFGQGMSLAGRDSLRLARELPFSEIRETAGGRALVSREPLGPVLAILTYNGPTTEVGLSVIPALLVGNPVIVKLPPENRLVGQHLAEAAGLAGFPDGVISVLTAEAEVSKHLVAHPGVAAVHFTGGTEIGAEVASVAGRRLVRTTLELGGKSAAIVLDDADLDATIPLLMAMTTFQGQICNSLTRVLVPETRHDEIVARLREAFGAVKVGDPTDPATEFGPLPTERVRSRAEGYIRRAVEAGATVAYGGKRPEGFESGCYLEPTLLTDVDNTMEVARNEIFGPVYCVIRYSSGVDEAIRIANDSPLGLAGAVFTTDTDKAMRVAAQVRVGTFWVNGVAPCLTAPYGGVKASGYGRVGGPEGFFDLTEIKQVVLP